MRSFGHARPDLPGSDTSWTGQRWVQVQDASHTGHMRGSDGSRAHIVGGILTNVSAYEHVQLASEIRDWRR